MRRLVFSTKLPLAVLRRTIHFEELIDESERHRKDRIQGKWEEEEDRRVNKDNESRRGDQKAKVDEL